MSLSVQVFTRQSGRSEVPQQQ